MINHCVGLLVNPRNQWQVISDLSDENIKRQLPYAVMLALLPAIAWFYGTTEFGWAIGDDTVRITDNSAMSLVAVFYIVMVMAVMSIGYAIHWMAHTYGAKSFPLKGIVIAGFAATPIFLAGAAGIYPVFWLDMVLATAAVGYTLYLLYLGIPIMMDLSEEKGFMFTSAIVAVSMIAVVAVMVGTVLFWDMVSAPVFIR